MSGTRQGVGTYVARGEPPTGSRGGSDSYSRRRLSPIKYTRARPRSDLPKAGVHTLPDNAGLRFNGKVSNYPSVDSPGSAAPASGWQLAGAGYRRPVGVWNDPVPNLWAGLSLSEVIGWTNATSEYFNRQRLEDAAGSSGFTAVDARHDLTEARYLQEGTSNQSGFPYALIVSKNRWIGGR